MMNWSIYTLLYSKGLLLKLFRKKIKQGNTNQDTINYTNNLCRGNVVRKSYNQQRDGADYKENPCSELEHQFNSLYPTHSILQTFLDISPISLMLDIGNQIIERKRKRVNTNGTEPESG